MPKTHKSILKRMRFTKTGKIMRLGSGVNHFQVKKSRSSQLKNKRQREVPHVNKNAIKAYLYK
jgi:ribosomal protein L35